MKEKRSGRGTWKKVIAVVLALSIVAGLGGGYLAMVFQPAPVVRDHTGQGGQEPDGGPGDGTGAEGGNGSGGDDQAQAVLNPNVKIFAEEEAQEINAAISNVVLTNQGMYLDIAQGTAFSGLGAGDIFYLDGGEDTPLGEIYIGKVAQVTHQNGTDQYRVETPAVDEVFDVLDFTYSQVMTPDHISEIETVPGITVTETEDVASYFADPDSQEGKSAMEGWRNSQPGQQGGTAGYIAGNQKGLSGSAKLLGKDKTLGKPGITPVSSLNLGSDGLVFEGSVDLLEVFGLDQKQEDEFFEKYDPAQGGSVSVYLTATGICYHRENCPCLWKSKIPASLSEAVAEGYEPCYRCNPPVYSGRSSHSLNLNVKVGVEDIEFLLNYDWDILNGNGIEELSMSADGDFLAEMELKAGMKYETAGKTTEYALPFDSVKLEGLREKMFPIAFVGYNGSVVTSMLGGNQQIRVLTGVMPVTVGAVIYVDIYGNISVGARAYVNYNQHFSARFTVVRDGEWVWEGDFNQAEPKIGMGVNLEVSGDVDAHAGASLCAYVFNLNLAELAIVKVGGEAEGNIQLGWSNDQAQGENGLSGTYYMRLYLKLFEINVKLKAKMDILFINAAMNFDYSHTFIDKTLAEWGTKSSTRFEEGLMEYSAVTARDQEAVYYKNTDGVLVREEDGERTDLYTEEFFSICGIDSSFLYVLRANESGSYDLYRISKSDGTNKRILEEVSQCLTIDESSIYYVSEFDHSSIYRLNRDTLREENFASFGEEVRFMRKQENAGGGYYVVTEDGGIIAQLLGGGYSYYLLDKGGNIAADYGSSPQVGDYYITDAGTYYQAARILTDGYLRSAAAEEYWMSKDGTASVKAEGVSGWNRTRAGIFTTQEGVEGSELPYEIVLYRAADGAKTPVTAVNSDQAFFTLCQSADGSWYFFDQTDTQLILYGMSEDFSAKWTEKEFSFEELPCSLEDCAMTIMDNRIYFYTMPDAFTSTVLYRYDLI